MINIPGVGKFSRLVDGRYQKHKTGQFVSEQLFTMEQFAVFLAESPRLPLRKDICALIEQAGWHDLLEAVGLAAAPRLELQALESQVEGSAWAREFEAFRQSWKPAKGSEFVSHSEYDYWSARAFVVHDHAGSEESEEDVSVRRLHLAAQHCVANWREFRGVDHDVLVARLAEMRGGALPPDTDDDLDLGSRLRRDGDLVASTEWDSGGPGAGAGIVEIYEFEDRFYVIHDAGISDYECEQDALDASGIETPDDDEPS